MVEVIERGSGPNVVLVHGAVFDAEMTFGRLAPLADRYTLRMVNRRGYGNSPAVTGEDFEVDANDVAALLKPGSHLVGHSYGGVVAMLAAALKPDDVASLTVVEPPAFALTAETEEAKRFRASVEELLAKGPTPEVFLREFIPLVGGDPSRLPQTIPPPMLRAASVQMNGRWPWEADVPLVALRKAPFPKMVVSGGHSALFDGVCDVLERELPARRVVIRGAGHSIPTLGEPFNVELEALWDGAGR